MAKLILTGQYEAIDLKALHGAEVLDIDTVAADMKRCNGGYGHIVVEFIKGIVVKAHINDMSYVFRKVKLHTEED